MKKLSFLLFCLGLLLLVLVGVWYIHPSDRGASAFVVAYFACLGGALAAALLYLGLHFGAEARRQNREETSRRETEAALAAARRDLEELSQNLDAAQKRIDWLESERGRQP